MGIVGELQVHRPTVIETILDLRQDLVVGQIGQVREAALSDAHEDLLFRSPLSLCATIFTHLETLARWVKF